MLLGDGCFEGVLVALLTAAEEGLLSGVRVHPTRCL